VKLSRTQRDAVNHPDNLALVSCPGSGKTRTLVAKLLVTIDEAQASTRLVACITYTNTAVHEIEYRLSRLSPAASTRCEVETIHSFCLKHIVAPHSWHLASFANGFSVLVPEDPVFTVIVDAIVKKFQLAKRASGAFEQLGRGTGVIPDDITEEAAAAYWAELDRRCVMDFSSIIYWAAKLVQDIPYIARGLASRYRWILVDEFQDTSSLQVDILRAVHQHARTRFFVVGDPFQSIMSFAGARPALLAQFGAEVDARADLQLLENYRSSRNVLAIADLLCPRDAPMVAAGEDRDHTHVPVWHAVPSMVEGVAEVFLPEVTRRGIDLSEVAVLANRWTSLLPLSRGLRGRNIPAVGPGARPYKRSTHAVAPLVEEVAAYIAEPGSRGVGQVRRELRRLIQTVTKATRSDLGFAGDVSAARLVRAAQQLGTLDGAANTFLEKFATVIGEEMLSAGFVSAEEGAFIQRSGRAMVDDIRRHEAIHNIRTTTVGDLGLFARGSKSVRLVTMHSSKGREFDAVALIDVFDGHVPFYTAKPGDETEAEGRRLLYVAVTRAKKLLMIFTLANPTSKTQPSRFLPVMFPGGARIA
jgi:DNA helicase II / ATP-dependent DNA helicase PcrA